MHLMTSSRHLCCTGNKVRITIIPPTPVHNTPSPSRAARGLAAALDRHRAQQNVHHDEEPEHTDTDVHHHAQDKNEAPGEHEQEQHEARVEAFSEQFLDRVTKEAVAEATHD